MLLNCLFICFLYVSPYFTSVVYTLHTSSSSHRRNDQHIAVLRSAPEPGLFSSDSKQSQPTNHSIRLFSFDDHTHILLGIRPNDHATLLKRHERSIVLEPNHLVKIASTDSSYNNNNTSMNGTIMGPYSVQLDVPSWGLSRISQRQLPLMNAFGYPEDAGQGVDIYIVDSGVDVHHSDFDGRAIWGANFVSGSPDVDENGHGTIIAGIAAGKHYGVAKKANIISVKCLAANGTSDVGTIIEGLHYILQRIQSGPQPPRAVINLSLVAEKSEALNQATDALSRTGAVIVAAAGNYHENDNTAKRNACLYSPSSASTVISVGSTDDKDNFATFSNDGKCVSILAPGAAILSDTMESNAPSSSSSLEVKTWYSGTSYSAPHVSGVLALLYNQQTNRITAHTNVTQLMYSLATPNLIKDVTQDTVNLLLFNGVETSQMSSIMSSTKQKSSACSLHSMVFSYWTILFLIILGVLF
ncbi:peptidase S8/S53 domain-containing protein [Halteromyces radiatus]|uniref:peptidase S8/S53 domain-containing protein n=1 Tax=Halteromyces radiatus TaxID=101107 RepID=UPI0022206F54|nr:peptidase S8/S53 domain-containing protein [Halteromyces radiatus]KAI8084565.1 peptidase S8/S53 domain-containing protein [Halteromyces radiatus]